MNYTKMLSMVAAIAATATGLILVAPPAFGEPAVMVTAPSEAPVAHISYADLNLASPAGEQRLNQRVTQAVGTLCSEGFGRNDLSMRLATKQCHDVAWYQARPQIKQVVMRAHEIAANDTSSGATSAVRSGISK